MSNDMNQAQVARVEPSAASIRRRRRTERLYQSSTPTEEAHRQAIRAVRSILDRIEGEEKRASEQSD